MPHDKELPQMQVHPVKPRPARVSAPHDQRGEGENTDGHLVVQDASTGLFFRKISDGNTCVTWTKNPKQAYRMLDQGLADYWLAKIRKLEGDDGHYICEPAPPEDPVPSGGGGPGEPQE